MKLDRMFFLMLVAILALSLGTVVACGDDDDDDDDDDSTADDDDSDDDSDDDDSGDDDDAVSDCEAWYAECGVDDGGYCDSLSSYLGLGECYDAALDNLFSCLAGVGCDDSAAISDCSTDFVSAIGDC